MTVQTNLHLMSPKSNVDTEEVASSSHPDDKQAQNVELEVVWAPRRPDGTRTIAEQLVASQAAGDYRCGL